MNKKTRYNLIGAALALVLIGLDQWTKVLAVKHLMGQEPFVIWNGVFELHYLENRGAAFGILQGQKGVFLICTALVLAILAFYYNRMPVKKRYLPMRIVGILLGAGAVGNLIDRMMQSYVVDFLYFKLIDFPIFNVADIYVTTATVILVFQILFVYKTNDFNFLSFNPKKFREL